MNIMEKRGFIILTALLCPFTASPANAHDIAAVLSSDSPYYLEAFSGFQDAIGYPVKPVNMQKAPAPTSAAEKVVVAFGGKAAAWEYQTGASVVSCLAPTMKLRQSDSGRYYYVSMATRPGLLFSKLKFIQPALKRLAVFWTSEATGDYLRQMRKEAVSWDIILTDVRLKFADELPERLRDMQGKTDAILFPPDPLLVTVQNFGTVRDFSAQYHVPFYVPTEALVERGATASVSSSFNSMGRCAARMAARLLKGETEEQFVYPDEVRLAVNLTAAGRAGLKITPK